MPIYEYLCDSCGTRFEKLVRRSDAATECPSCNNKKVTQQLSTFAAHANGSAGEASMPSCPGGMCSNPSFCGRN